MRADWQKAVFLLVALFLTSCVTSTTSTRSTPNSADPEAAFERHLQLAMQYIGSNRRDLARVHLEKAGKFKKRSAELYNGYALLYQLEQEFELAESQFKKAIASDSKLSSARYNYSSFLFQQSRFNDAAEQMRIVTKDLTYARRPQSFYLLGLMQLRLNEQENALQSFERALQLAPRFAPPYLETAEIYFEQQRYAMSKRLLDTFVQLARPTSKSLWLAVRLEDRFNNKDGVASEGLKLKKLFPYSKENLEYQDWLKARE